jgi:hypothetical protein
LLNVSTGHSVQLVALPLKLYEPSAQHTRLAGLE